MSDYPLDNIDVSSQESSVGSIVLDYLRTLVAARDCAAAVESGKHPSAESLRQLGIDPAAFAEVRLV